MYQPKLKIGLIGGGQLARMLALAAHPLGMTPVVFSESQQDPAGQVVRDHVPGQMTDPKALSHFLSQVDLVTFESEFAEVPVDGEFAFVRNQEHKFFPHLGLMARIQNRHEQKKLLATYKVAQPEFCFVPSMESLKSAMGEFGFPAVLKKTKGGYDGYGTFVLKTKKKLERFLADATANSHLKQTDSFTLERFVAFERELATLFVRSKLGTISQFPLVETRQKDNRCDFVLGPVRDSKTQRKLHKVSHSIERLMQKENYVGVLAVEMFETGTEILVNELAPRVHNSGHYTQDALNLSQFSAHLLAGMGLKLPKPILRSPGFVMANLIGESSSAFEFPALLEGNLHWYGKSENRKGRKMGHINYLGTQSEKLIQLAKAERRRIKR